MGMCFLYGTGKAGASDAGGMKLTLLCGGDRPETAERNTVWVDAEEATGEYRLCANEPEGKEGLLWLCTLDWGVRLILNEAFPLVLMLSSAKVFHEDVWTTVDHCDVFTEKGWQTVVEPALKLYHRGDLCKHVTGGWNSTPPIVGVTTLSQPEYLEDSVYFQSDTTNSMAMCTNNMIAVDGYKSVTVDWSVESTTSSDPNMSLFLTFLDEAKKNKIREFAFGPAGPRRTDNFSLGDLTGSYYIAMRLRTYHATNATEAQKLKAHFYGVQLEPGDVV